MAKIILVNGTIPLSVKLQLDMHEHGEACRAFADSKARLKIAEDALCGAVATNIDVLSTKLVEARLSLLVAEINLKREHDMLSLQLTAIAGSLPWLNIKMMLSTQCNNDNLLEKNLSSLLAMSQSSKIIPPLGLESLDNSFVELLKNSMDATIKQYLAHASDNMMLEMDVVLAIQDEKLAITITDNAGGFAPAYLAYFNDSIKSKSYKSETRLSEKQQDRRYFFGGASRGISILCNLIMDGEVLESPGISKKRYQVAEGETSISIANDPLRNGAQIRLVSPLAPFALFVENSTPISYGIALSGGLGSINHSGIMARRLKQKRPALPPITIGRVPSETAQVFNSSTSAKSSPRTNTPKRSFFIAAPLLGEDSVHLRCYKAMRV